MFPSSWCFRLNVRRQLISYNALKKQVSIHSLDNLPVLIPVVGLIWLALLASSANGTGADEVG
jgi:hypothetical protein